MTDSGNAQEPDLWANTGKQPSVPPPPTSAAPPDLPGAPPPAQPPTPPTGGPNGPNGSGSDRPAWMVPAAIGAAFVIAAGLTFLFTRAGGDDTVVSGEATLVLGGDTTIEAESTVLPETTIDAETTIVTETTIAAETTIEPTTTVPTSAAPTTAAPAATAAPAPAGIIAAQPGQALVDGVAHNITSGCTTTPRAGFSLRSFVAASTAGPLVIEQANTDGNVAGLFSEVGNPLDTSGYVALGDGFGMIATRGGTKIIVSVNPSGIALNECGARGTVRLADPAAPAATYTYGIVDLCATASPLRALAYLSQGGTARIIDNADGTATVTVNAPGLFDATNAAAALTSAGGGRQSVTGEITGSTIDGDTTQLATIEFDTATARACNASETP